MPVFRRSQEVKGVLVLLVVGIETVFVRAQSREMAERTARRAQQYFAILGIRLAVTAFMQAAEPMVVHHLRLTDNATRTRFAAAARCVWNAGGRRGTVCFGRGAHGIHRSCGSISSA